LSNLKLIWLFVYILLINFKGNTQDFSSPAFKSDDILSKMYLVHDYFLANEWKNSDRNWIRGTYYRGLMAFYKSSEDSNLLNHAKAWATRHGWRPGTEWPYPANRLTCAQTYLDLYFINPDKNKIKRTRKFMDKRVYNSKPASEQGWDYVDALFVGVPAYMMMSKVTSDPVYSDYGNKIFMEVYSDLFDFDENLFYRDKRAKEEKSDNGNKVLWSRGNGWAIASIPSILENLPIDHEASKFYIELVQKMSKSLAERQSKDGFWRANLADSLEYSNPESSGTAFFIYAMAWGINNGYLDRKVFEPVVIKAWIALYYCVNENGKVQWGQDVARKPEHVSENDSREFVSGALLLAGSEILILVNTNN